MVNQTVKTLVDAVLLTLKEAGWGLSCNAFGVEIRDNKAVTAQGQGSTELAYIGISDTLGTYLYIRENGGTISVSGASLGSCENGTRVAVLLRAVAVSNNLRNTPHILADKLFIDLLNVSLKSTKQVLDIDVQIQAVSTNFEDILHAETGVVKGAPISLAAIDFELSFTISGCNLPKIKLC